MLKQSIYNVEIEVYWFKNIHWFPILEWIW